MSTKHVQRCSRIVGALGDEIDQVYTSEIAETTLHLGRHVDEKDYQANDVEKFVGMYRDEKLWKVIPGRKGHKGFSEFVNRTQIHKPEKLRERLKKYSKKLDEYTDLVNKTIVQ